MLVLRQLIEALVWLGTGGGRPDGLAGAAGTAWTVVALPLLPVFVSAAVWCATSGPRRRTLATLTLLGAAVAVPLAVAVVSRPVTANVRGHTLGYAVGVPNPALLLAGYLLATIGSFR